MSEEQIGLSHRNLIEKICRKYGNDSSSHSFASLYIWRESMGSRVYIGEDMFSFKCDAKGSNSWMFPCGNDNEKKEFINSRINEKDFKLCYIREKDIEFLNKHFYGKFVLEERPQDSEYIYDRQLWERIEGRKYAGCRNHIRRAMRDNDLYVKVISEEDIENIYRIISEWDRVKKIEGTTVTTDEHSARELISNFRELSVFGIVVYVEDVPFAVVAGFPLSNSMFDMCLAKQKRNLSGLSVYAKHQFVCLLEKKYKYINAEEDLGIEGLRIMKQQMQPIGQIKMFDGRFLKNE